MEALKIIPQAFFDLIARVTPGLVFLLLLAWLEPDAWRTFAYSAGSLTGDPAEGLSIWLLLGASYVVGHLLSPATKLIQRVSERYPRSTSKGKKSWRKWCRDWRLVNTPARAARLKPDSKHYDWLRVHSPEVGGIAAKLRAEFTLYNALSATFFLFACDILVRSPLPLAAMPLLLLCVFMAARGRETQETMRNCVENFYRSAKETPPKVARAWPDA